MNGGLLRRTIVASVVLAGLFAAVFACLLLAIEDLEHSGDRTRHSEQVIAEANRLEKLVLDLETGERGFIITGDERFLEPWNQARVAFPRQVLRLELLTSDNDEQRTRARDIARAGDSLISEYFGPTIAVARRDLAAGRGIVAGGEGKRRVDAIRAQFASFAAAEDALLAGRSSRESATARRAVAIGVGGVVGLVLLMLLFVVFVARSVLRPIRRVSAAAALVAANDTSARVPEGGAGEVGDLGRSFNEMAAAIQAGRSELENQNIELELQATTLETQAQALEEQQLELDLYFTHSLDMLGIAGLDGVFRRLNPAFEQTLGYSVEELTAAPFIQFVHPDDRASTLNEVASLSRGIDTVAFENRYRCRDGSYRWIQWSSTAIPERGLIYAAARDITDRKLAEEQTRSLNQELESQNLELELNSAELESRQAEIEVANTELEAQQAELERALDDLAAEKGRVERFYRFADRLMGESDLDLLSQLAFDEICDFAQAEIGTLYVLDVEHRAAFALAAARGVEASSVPATLDAGVGLPGRALHERRTIAVSHGETGLHLTVFGRQVSVHHELHLPLVHADRVLGVLSVARIADRPFSADDREAIDHLAGQAAIVLSSRLALKHATRLGTVNRAVLDATLDGIRLVDLAGNTILANAEIERLTTEAFGLPAGSTLDERSMLIARQLVDTGAYDAASATIAADPEATTLDEFELEASRRSFRRYTAPVRTESGALMGRIIVVREITNEREVARLKSELVATVSHELRTPLTGIMGFAELLAKQELDDPTRRMYVETIHVEALRLTALVNDFLDLQRIEAGGFTLALAPFDLNEVVRREAALHFAQSDAHTIRFRLSDVPMIVQGERDRVGQVVANLLSNAIKYSPDGGDVWVETTIHSDVVRTSITDAGFGIPLDQQAHIFTKFFRVDSSDTRRIGGTGLGLALSREIIDAHGGAVGFESTEGEGSTFWFELPLLPSANLTERASSEDRVGGMTP